MKLGMQKKSILKIPGENDKKHKIEKNMGGSSGTFVCTSKHFLTCTLGNLFSIVQVSSKSTYWPMISRVQTKLF